MNQKNILSAAEEYFSSMNPIAAKIYSDFEEIKNSYENVWSTLSYEEQTQILNEYIIKPEVSLKYDLKTDIPKDKSEDTVDKKAKDSHIKFKDEHGVPFSYKTVSQLDLRLFGNKEISKEIEIKKSPKIEPVKPVKVQIQVPDKIVVPPVVTTTTTAVVEPLPKTGLDFLDNW